MTPARTSATISARASPADSASVGATTSATDTARRPVTDADPHGRRQPEPAVGRVVQRPRVLRGVDGRLGAGFMHQSEPAPDHRVADLADRKRARHRARPAQPQQAVGAGELVDGGPAVDTRHTVPQRQSLRVAQHITDAATHDQSLAERAAVGLHRGRLGRRADDRALGQQVPRTFACLRMRRILVVDGQLVADLAVGDQLATRRGFDQRADPAAARRVHAEPVVLVGNRTLPSNGSQPSAAFAGASR